MTALELRALSHHYGEQQILDGLTFQLDAGECVALLGESGSGKSTALRCIAGLEQPSSGQIFIAGTEVYGSQVWVPTERRGVGLVFQDYALFPSLNVAENIAFGLPVRDAQRVEALLRLTGLEAWSERRPAQLSGGQQQRVALARALAPRPSLLLLDEPFANVDAHRRSQLGQALRKLLQAEGTSALLVTHDQSSALVLCDRLAVLTPADSGAILGQMDSPETVYNHPVSEDVARLTGPVYPLNIRHKSEGASCLAGDVNVPASARTLLARPRDLKFDCADNGPAEVLFSGCTGQEFVILVQQNDQQLELHHATRLPQGQRGHIRLKRLPHWI